MMQQAEIGEFLYIIIAVVLMIAGGVEKYVKSKKEQQQRQQSSSTNMEQQQEEYGENRDFSGDRRVPPQTLEEMVKRMLQSEEYQERTPDVDIDADEAQSLEEIPEKPLERYQYQPLVITASTPEEEALYAMEDVEQKDNTSYDAYDFDLRQAVIASEILQRKY